MAAPEGAGKAPRCGREARHPLLFGAFQETVEPGEETAMKSGVDLFVTLLALLFMPFIGLSAAAHEAEDGSNGESMLMVIVSVVIFVQLARMFWNGLRERRLHRAR